MVLKGATNTGSKLEMSYREDVSRKVLKHTVKKTLVEQDPVLVAGV